MGLTSSSSGFGAVDAGLLILRDPPETRVVALAGNPNVGKSTLFNGLTGMNQHTGNWPGKTVTCAQGRCSTDKGDYILVDIPGTYSLLTRSAEEDVARDFLCFGEPDAAVVVCDATCLERNLNLVLQIMEVTDRVVVCVNLLDEARRKGICVDLEGLSKALGVPVAGVVAREKKSLQPLLEALEQVTAPAFRGKAMKLRYPEPVEGAVELLVPAAARLCGEKLCARWLSLRLLEGDAGVLKQAEACLGRAPAEEPELAEALRLAREKLGKEGLQGEKLKDQLAMTPVKAAEAICRQVVQTPGSHEASLDRKLDRLLTSRRTGYPVMLALLAVVFWLTITGANYPSQWLSAGLFWVQDRLTELFACLGAPDWLHGLLVLGLYRVLAWVVSVMLPPMAIFFPLFTLLEDAGYLPRVAYNLDKPFKSCRACGKQALTMCMGFGCNAAGVVGCRIIDSPRERLLAMLTNSFVPCNGRFPTLITLLTMFFVGSSGKTENGLLGAMLLTAVILLGVLMTLLTTRLLSATVLKGVPSSFTLELPPYRRPQLGKVLVRSVLDRTLFVLGRAAAVAAPAGALLWVMANAELGGISLLGHCAAFLDPFARLMGLDGVILMAFLLSFPANEIVMPVIIMAYLAQGSLPELGSLEQMRQLFVENGWTWATAVSMVLFSLMHWPCSTTLLTIHKETGSWKWTALAAALPTALGVISCMAFTALVGLFS